MNTVDSFPPVVIGCPRSNSYTTPFGTFSQVATWIEPTATDDSGIMPTRRQSHAPGDRFPVGETTVSYIFLDLAGNEARCSFTITGKYG